jgi:hypothetical protein
LGRLRGFEEERSGPSIARFASIESVNDDALPRAQQCPIGSGTVLAAGVVGFAT